jgi:virulence-associated protein VapD
MTNTDDLFKLVLAIDTLKKIDWFRNSVRDIRGYKV